MIPTPLTNQSLTLLHAHPYTTKSQTSMMLKQPMTMGPAWGSIRSINNITMHENCAFLSQCQVQHVPQIGVPAHYVFQTPNICLTQRKDASIHIYNYPTSAWMMLAGCTTSAKHIPHCLKFCNCAQKKNIFMCS